MTGYKDSDGNEWPAYLGEPLLTDADGRPLPAHTASLDGEDWWAERAQDYWKRWHGGLPLSPAPFDVAVRLGRRDGEVVVTGLHIETDGEPLRDRDLRTISLRRLLQDLPEGDRLADAERPTVFGRNVDELRPRRPGRRGYDDEHFRRVAEVYSEIRERYPNSPTAKTAEVLHASGATVRRWVARARELGYIEELDS